MRNMKDASDLDEGFAASQLTGGSGRQVDLGPNDKQSQHKAAAVLGYKLHGNNCTTCGEAQSESQLCSVGQRLYQMMRDAGAVD